VCSHPSIRSAIDVTWLDERTVHVTIDGTLDWTIALTSTPVTRIMTFMCRLMPHWMWTNPALLSLMGRMSGPMLDVGKVRLTGWMPNGQHFAMAPLRIWAIEESRATLDGQDLGVPQRLATQTRLGGFWLPQRGLFMTGFVHFDAFDATKHISAAEHDRELREAAS
jgi:hypothetical protein